MKKKGFTLIELLAVIVILAIIALIAVPIVMNVIENSKKRAAERSAVNYVHAVETAVATKKLNGPVEDGTYTVDENGDLVQKKDGKEIKIEVETKGAKPREGNTLKIQNYQVVREGSSLEIGGYPVSYNTSKKTYIVAGEKVEDEETTTPGTGNEGTETPGTDNNEPSNPDSGDGGSDTSGTDTFAKICRPATASEYGNIPVGNYAYGDEYICNVGAAGERNFYVLEKTGDNVSLIMSQDYTDDQVPEKVSWCNLGNCSESGLFKYTEHIQTIFGNDVTVSLPTGKQIATASGSTSWTSSSDNSVLVTSWLLPKANSGYWTTTTYLTEKWFVKCNGVSLDLYGNISCIDGYLVGNMINMDYKLGVRPVITISKNNIG